MQCRWRSLVLVTEDVLRGQTVLLVPWQFGLRARHVGQVRASIPRSREGRREKEDPRPDRGDVYSPLANLRLVSQNLSAVYAVRVLK